MNYLSLSGNQVFMIIAILFVMVYLSIIGLRWYWTNKMKSPSRIVKDSPLKHTNQRMAIGMIISLVAAITLMSWTESERKNFMPYIVDSDVEEIITIPRTLIETNIAKPIRKLVNPEILLIDDPLPLQEPKLLLLDVPAEAIISDDVSEIPEDIVVPPTQALPEPIEVEPPVFSIVEQMPRFPGCEADVFNQDERKACSEKALFNYIYSKLKYPSYAINNGIEGKVVVQFIVDTNGDIQDIIIARDIGGGCGEAAKKVIENMVKDNGLWIPGRQQSRNVKVKYSLPIDFRLH